MALAAHSMASSRSSVHAARAHSQGACALSKGWGASRPRALVVAAASPWEDMNREFAALDRQFAAMDQEFADMDRQFADMTRQFNRLDSWERQVDQELSDAMQRTQASLAARRQQLQLELDRQQQQQQQEGLGIRTAPGVVVFEGSESGAGAGAGTGFSYYRNYRLSIQTDVAPSYLPPPPVTAAPVSPLVLVAALIASVHVAVTATFVKNFHLTTYAPKWRLGLSVAWPALAAFNSKFRQQFVCALKGQRAPVLKSQDGQEADGQTPAAEAR